MSNHHNGGVDGLGGTYYEKGEGTEMSLSDEVYEIFIGPLSSVTVSGEEAEDALLDGGNTGEESRNIILAAKEQRGARVAATLIYQGQKCYSLAYVEN